MKITRMALMAWMTRWSMHDRSEMRLRPLSFTREDLELIYQGLWSRWGGRLHWTWRDERVV
jgi:hypothetical protein